MITAYGVGAALFVLFNYSSYVEKMAAGPAMIHALFSAAGIVASGIIILCFYPLSRKKLAEVAEALRKASVNADEMGAGEMKLAVETSGAGEGVTESVSGNESLEIIDYTAQDDAPTGASADGGQDAGGFLDGSGGDDSGK